VLGLVAGEQLCVANTGDCVALLAHAGSSERLSMDHRADNAAELVRVLTAGGEVDYDQHGTLRIYRPNDHFRLNGAMFTRSLGDFAFKSPAPLLTSEPHVTQQQLSPADRLVLLTSDGVTDVLPDDDVLELALRAVDKARERTDDGQELAQAAATEVMCAALQSGSADNITAVTMLLDWS
jgi:serine/threonine protein phosphatase PrpC